MKFFKHFLALMVLMSSTGCATMSNRTKTILSMIGVGFVAGTIAANLAPENDNPSAHGLMWGASAAVVTGVASLYLYDDEGKKKEAERKLEVARIEIDTFRGESESSDAQIEIDSESGLSRSLPNEYKGLVKPGRWSIYKINNWVSQGENSLVHQDRILRIDPPQFQPSNLANKTEGESK